MCLERETNEKRGKPAESARAETRGALTSLKTLDLNRNPLAKPQSSAVETWLAALEAEGCEVKMIVEDEDSEW